MRYKTKSKLPIIRHKLLASNDHILIEKVEKKVKRRWLIVGAVECILIVSGLVISLNFDSLLFSLDYFFAGLLLSVLFGIFTLKYTPKPPIGFDRSQKSNLSSVDNVN